MTLAPAAGESRQRPGTPTGLSGQTSAAEGSSVANGGEPPATQGVKERRRVGVPLLVPRCRGVPGPEGPFLHVSLRQLVGYGLGIEADRVIASIMVSLAFRSTSRVAVQRWPSSNCIACATLTTSFKG